MCLLLCRRDWGQMRVQLGKTLMLGKIEGRQRRGRQKMRWLDGITDSKDMSLDREACRAAIHGIANSQTRLSDWTELNYPAINSWKELEGAFFCSLYYKFTGSEKKKSPHHSCFCELSYLKGSRRGHNNFPQISLPRWSENYQFTLVCSQTQRNSEISQHRIPFLTFSFPNIPTSTWKHTHTIVWVLANALLTILI